MAEKEKTQIGAVRYTRAGGKNAGIAGSYLKGLNELRAKVKGRISEINDLMVSDTNLDINVRDTIKDLAEKIQYLLYCDGEYCKFEKSLLWALDFADDIMRVSAYSGNIDIYAKGSQIAYDIRKFYYT